MKNSEKARIFRERFYGNQEVYGREWITTKPDGTPLKGFSPVCDNFWKAGCHIKLKDGISCSKCEIKKYTPVSDESVLKHIRGEELQIQYVLQANGSLCKFAAFDFDKKPGKEKFAYEFEDVKKVTAVLSDWGISYAIARSTGLGYHLYMFFSDFVEAVKIRSVMFEIADRCGFIRESNEGIRPLLEIFPKNNQANGGLGNGVKCGMIEPNFERGRNCLVDETDTMIPADLQWEYLDKVGWNNPELIDEIIAKENIQVEEDFSSSSGGKPRSGTAYSKREGWQKPLHGSIEKVLSGCAAFSRVKDKCAKREDLTHFEGTALWHIASHTADGQDWFLKNTNWGQTESDMRQLEHSLQKDYSPWTCKKLQECGVCKVGTKCFEKKPPVDRVDGQIVVREDVPKEQWPEPSPIRYSFSAGDDFLQRLLKEVEDLDGEDDLTKRALALKDIIKRSQVFDLTQQSVLKDKIEQHKLAKRSQLNRDFKEARAEKEAEFVEAASSRGDSIIVNGTIYRKLNPYGFASLRQGKGDQEILKAITDFDMIIDEERVLIEDSRTSSRVYIGRFINANGEIPFEIPSKIWMDNSELYQTLGHLCGRQFNVLKMDLDQIRQVVMRYRENECTKSVFYGTQGWYDNMYLMPSVIVDKDGVKPNTEKQVDLHGKEHAGNIDFSILSEDDLKETLFHIKNEFFNTFHRGCVFVGLGHTLMAGIRTYLGVDVKPTLWYEGDSGNGKTQLAINLQKFYGDFKGGLNWSTSGKSMIDYGFQFRDTMLLADDYKGDSPQQVQAAKMTVQNSYDFSSSGALSRTGQQRGDKQARCFYMMTGEETPVNHASVIARMCLVEYPKFDTSKTQELFESCKIHSDNYRGVTPHFIHWVLQQNRAELQKIMRADRAMLKEAIAGTQNDDRVASNTGLAFTGFRFFVEFMLSVGAVANRKEADALIEECKHFMFEVRDRMSIRCSEEKNGVVFLNRLKELLFNGEAVIKYLEGFDRMEGRYTVVGFVDDKDETPGTAYLYPGEVINLIKGKMASNLVVSPQSVGTQWLAAGIINKTTTGRLQYRKKIRGSEGDGIWVWAVSLEKMGLGRDKPLRTVHQTEPLPLMIPNAEGLI